MINLNYPNTLYSCDSRVKFTKDEIQLLCEYEKQIIELEQKLDKYLIHQADSYFKDIETKDNINLEITNQLLEIESNCASIQITAELRFVEYFAHKNHEIIIEDIKELVSNQSYIKYLKSTKEPLSNLTNPKDKIKKFSMFLSRNFTRMYENYCYQNNMLELIERIGVLIMQTAREKIKQETGIDLKSDFSMIKYSEVLSDFRKIDVKLLPKSKQNDEVLRFNDIKSFEMVDLTNDKRLSVAALKLIDLFAMFYEKEGYFTNKRFRMSVSEYMEICDLKHSGNARNQICQGLNNLYNLSIKMLKSDRDNRSDFFESRIIQSKSIRNGYIEVIFSDLFIQILNKRKWMNFPNQLFRIKDKINPYSHYFLKKIAEHKNMNHNKNNEDILTIKTILGSCMSFPKYEEVKNIGGITQRIKLPFYRDMDALSDTLTYSLKDDNHNEITREKANSMTYDDFVNLRVYIIWLAYPDRKKLITYTN